MTRITREIELPCEKRGQGKTRHFRSGDSVSEKVTSVQIVQFAGDNGFYVLYFDADNSELNDLYFDTLASAKDHIEWEFSVAIQLEGSEE